MPRFVPGHLKTKKCVNMQWKSCLLWYFTDRYKTQKMCDEVIVESSETLMLVPDC